MLVIIGKDLQNRMIVPKRFGTTTLSVLLYGIIKLKLFEIERLPKLTHGVCPVCLEGVMAELEKLKASLQSKNRMTPGHHA